MQEKHIRQIIREILQEEDATDKAALSDPLSLVSRTLFPVGQLGKLLIISPGIDNASGPGFSWTLAAPEHVKYSLEAGLPERGVGVVVARNSGVPISAVLKEISSSKDMRIQNLLSAPSRILLGFSGGGSTVIRYTASGDGNISTFSKIYLADPAANSGTVSLIPAMGSSLSKIEMTYNPDNWGGTPNLDRISRELPFFAKKLNAAAGTEVAKLVKKSHIEHLKSMLARI